LPKCPKCKKEIDYVKCYSKAEQIFNVSLEQYPKHWKTTKALNYNHIDTISLDKKDDYECPECNAELFFATTKDLMKFLDEDNKNE
jgi:hypothetical protein